MGKKKINIFLTPVEAPENFTLPTITIKIFFSNCSFVGKMQLGETINKALDSFYLLLYYQQVIFFSNQNLCASQYLNKNKYFDTNEIYNACFRCFRCPLHLKSLSKKYVKKVSNSYGQSYILNSFFRIARTY